MLNVNPIKVFSDFGFVPFCGDFLLRFFSDMMAASRSEARWLPANSGSFNLKKNKEEEEEGEAYLMA